MQPLNDAPRQPKVTQRFESWVDLVEHQATLHLGKTAFTYLKGGERSETTITFGELGHKCRSIAARLQQCYCEGDRVLLAFPSGVDYIVAFLACLFAGAIAVPAYPPRANRSLSRLSAIVHDARPVLALTNTSIHEHIDSLTDGNLSQVEWLALESVDDACPANWTKPNLEPGTLAYLQYTSGSTSQPKGVMISHGNLLHNSESLRAGFGSTEQDTFVTWLPLFHDMGLAGNVLQSLYLGAHCVIMSPESFLAKPVRWLQAITDYDATVSGGPNFAYDLCSRKIPEHQKTRLDLSGWQLAFNGAEPVHRETIERFASSFESYGFRPNSSYPCYGLAEATVFVSGGTRDDPPVFRSADTRHLEQGRFVETTGSGSHSQVGCGRAWLDDGLVIVDPVSRMPGSPGTVGEIWVSGPSVAAGYWQQESETEKEFRATIDGVGDKCFLRTGDLGFILDGELYITGRIKDLIIIAGRNHFPQDIERTVEACHELIRPGCSAAVAIEHDAVERLYVVAELDRSYRHRGRAENGRSDFDPSLVARAVSETVMENHELPVHGISLVKPATIPKTSSGKIQRNACRTAYLDDSLETIYRWTRSDSTAETQRTGSLDMTEEDILAWIVQRVVDVTGAGPGDVDIKRPFTDYIRNSIDVFDATMAMAEWIGKEVPNTLLWTNPTITDIAAQISDLVAAGADGETEVQAESGAGRVNVVKLREGGGPILFGLHAAGGMVFLRRMASYLDEGQPFYAIQGVGLDIPESTDPPFRDIYELAGYYVDELTRIQPSGAYHICGIYGTIVLEVGQQLHQRGKETALAIVFDNVAPSLPDAAGKRPAALRPIVELSRGIKNSQWLKQLMPHSRKQGPDGDAGQREIGVARAINNRLRADYTPNKYAGKINFIRSEEFSDRASKDRHVDSWRAITDDLVVHVTPGTHYTMWREPHARDLAGLIQKLVNDARNR